MMRSFLRYSILTIVISLLAFRPAAIAQLDATLYHMSTIPQVRYTNPSNGSDYKWYIGLPAISSIYANMHNNGFVIEDLLKKRSDDSVYFDMNGLFDQLDDRNLLGFNLQVDLLAFGFKKGKNQFFMNITEKAMMRIRYPKDFLRLIWEGNGAFIDETLDFSGMALRFTEYREYAFGMSREFNDKLTIGAKVKILGGLANLSSKVSKLELYTAPNTFELSGTSDLKINTSIPEDDSFNKSLFSFTNFGLGIDMGATYKLTDDITLSGSIIDLGYIKWKRNTTNISNDLDNATFKGNAIETFVDSTGENPFTQIIDSLRLTFDNSSETHNAYNDGLIPRIYVGGTYAINENNNAGALFHGEYFQGTFYPSFTLSYNYKLPRWIGASASYSIMNGSFVNLGLGVSLNLGPFQLYLVSDNIGALFNLASISSVPVPYKAKTMHLRTGIGLTFGKTDKDKDNDGIPDKEDECPDVKGPKELNGCPDTDGDGVIDKHDDCPNDSGLPINKGCPDKDADNIIDKEDDCPDAPGPIENKGCPVKLSLLDAMGNELMSAELNDDGFFVFENLPDKNNFLFKLNAEDVGLVEEVQVLHTLDGKETILTAYKTEDGVFEFTFEEERKQKLYLIDHKGDTLQMTEINDDGFFVFSNLPVNQSHLFLLDGEDSADDLLVMLIDENGNETIIKANKRGGNSFEYAYIPPKVADLDLLETPDVPVILLEEEKEILNTAFDHLEFNVGSDVIRYSSYKSLQQLSKLLVKKPDWRIKLSGYTDNIGGASHNLMLSKKRAEAVKRALIRKGVPSDRIIVQYYGEEGPIADNATKEGQQANRRVEMLIIESRDDQVSPTSDTESSESNISGEEGIKGEEGNLVFKVQIFAASHPIFLAPANFKGLENVEEYKHGGLYKYVVGRSLKYDYASAVLLTEVKSKGIQSAFVVAFKNGKRIPITDAMKLGGN